MKKPTLLLLVTLSFCVGCAQKDQVKDVHTISTPQGTEEIITTTEVKKTGQFKHGKHNDLCSCPKDTDGSCKCNHNGGICECTK